MRRKSERSGCGAERNARCDDRSGQRGAAAALLAILLPVFVGLLGLVIDVGNLHAMRRRAQTAADATAMAAAHELRKQNTSGYKEVAVKDAVLNGFDPDNGAKVQINRPPTSGYAMGNMNFVEVVVQRRTPLLFMQVLGADAVTVEARSVAGLVDRSLCLFALNPEGSHALKINGNAELEVPECGVYVRSNHPSAAVTTGVAKVVATTVNVVGNYSGNGFFPAPETSAAVLGDPLEDLKAPLSFGCSHDDTVKVTDSVTLHPGTYCGGIEVVGNGSAKLMPGVYVLRGGGLKVTGGCGGSSVEDDDKENAGGNGNSGDKGGSDDDDKGNSGGNGNSDDKGNSGNAGSSSGGSKECKPANIEGDEVVFYNTEGSGYKYGPISFTGNATGRLTPPDSGSYKGVLFFQDPSVSSNQDNKFAGDSSVELTGGAYFPTTGVDIAGNASVRWHTISLVAWEVKISGTAKLQEVDRTHGLIAPAILDAAVRE